MQRLSLVLLVTCAVAALVVAEPQPEPNFRQVLHKAHVKLSHAAHKVKESASFKKLQECLKKTPGVPAAVKGVITGCASSATGGMGAIATCAARKAAIPAARATTHLAACMG